MPKIKQSLGALAIIMIGSLFRLSAPVFAEESTGDSTDIDMSAATSISITPVSKVLTFEPNTVYEDSFKVTNNGTSPMTFEVYASPYSFTTSADSDTYSLNFNTQTSFTQIARWVTFQDEYGNWVETTEFTADGGEAIIITYRISTPDSVPNGGQYAVLFAHTISEELTTSGIRTEASPGIIVYGRSTTGETIRTAELSDLNIYKKVTTSQNDGTTAKRIGATAHVKNTGNIDFTASGRLQIKNIFGDNVVYTTADNTATISIIPSDSEEGTIMTISDEWKDTPSMGIFYATWVVTAINETKEISKLIIIMPIYMIIIMLIILTGIVFGIIILIKKRKERRSRVEA